jgi:hypothetical protein
MRVLAAALVAAFSLLGSAEARACADASRVIADVLAADAKAIVVDDVTGPAARLLMERIAAVAPPPRAVRVSEIVIFRPASIPGAVLVVLLEEGCATLSTLLPEGAVMALLEETRA